MAMMGGIGGGLGRVSGGMWVGGAGTRAGARRRTDGTSGGPISGKVLDAKEMKDIESAEGGWVPFGDRRGAQMPARVPSGLPHLWVRRQPSTASLESDGQKTLVRIAIGVILRSPIPVQSTRS